MSTTFIMRNQQEIINLLRKLPKGYDSKFLRKTLGFATTPTLRAAKERAPSRVGILARSMGKIQLRKARFVSLVIGPRVKGAFRASRDPEKNRGGWYAHFVEFGTKGYTLKKRKILKTKRGIAVLKKGTFIPGQPPRSFMRAAWDSTRAKVEQRFFDKIESRMELEVKRLTTKGVL